MSFKTKALGVFGAALITLGTIGGVSAGTTADVSVKVGAPANAVLSASITAGTFQEVKYQAGTGTQDSTGSITVTATDTRGVGSGWSVTLSGNGDFKDGDKSFALSSFGLQAGSTAGVAPATANGITGSAITSLSTSGQTVMVASKGNGLGVFNNTIQSTVKVPNGTLVGDYKTTLTVGITAGQ